MAIAYRFKPIKARQLAAGFLRQAVDHTMNYTKLIKLMYLADRESMLTTGFPITGDECFALPKGPILSTVLNCIRGEIRDQDWLAHFRTSDYTIQMIADPGDDELSRFDDDLIAGIFKRYDNIDYGDMIQHTHDFPEWKCNRPDGANKARKIAPEDIFAAGGKTSREISVFEELAAEALDLDFSLAEV